MRDRRPLIMVAACAVWAAGCSTTAKSTNPTGPTGPTGTATAIAKVSGDSQADLYTAKLPRALVVKVTDKNGNAVSGATVAWILQFFGASQGVQITTTGANGQTEITPTPAGQPGFFSIEAAINGDDVVFAGSANIPLASGPTKLQANEFANCALTTAGAAWCWGWTESQEFGNTDTGVTAGPAPVSGSYAFSQISMGTFMVCGLTSTGALYCWGDATNGSLGNGIPHSGMDLTTPTAAGDGDTFTSISVTDNHSCGMVSGAPRCWGNNYDGLLGTGDTTSYWVPTPVQVPTGVTFVSVVAGGNNTCALTASGAAYCWGENSVGQLGNGNSSQLMSDVPVAVAGGHSFTSLSVGTAGACGLTASGTVYCWGSGLSGNGTSTAEYSPTAIQQPGLIFTQLAVLYLHACALTSTGAAYCWGINDHADLGSVSASGLTPVAVPGGYAFKTILPGGASTCGLTTSNAMLCWGSNVEHQLGLGFNTDTLYSSPMPVPGMGYP